MVMIKPHHFMDMIKLYGGGCDTFVPDERSGHSFYLVGNEILTHPETELQFTLDCDDVCEHCIHKDGRICRDSVSGLGDYTSKDAYNKMLDLKLMNELHLDPDRSYTAKAYCSLLYANKELIYSVWTLEPQDVTEKRYELFCEGCRRYLHL